MFDLRLLGAIDLRTSDGVELPEVLRGPKRIALLTYLALQSPRGFQRRDAVVDLLWPKLDHERARHALRNTLHSLRRATTSELVVNRGDEEVGLAPEKIWCDAIAFEEALSAKRLVEAIELYEGELLKAFFVPEAPGFEQWLDAKRRTFRAAAAYAAWEVSQHFEAQGDNTSAKRFAARAVRLEPADEVGMCRLIAFLDRIGDRLGAVHAYEEFSRRFQEEFGLLPSPETRALIRTIKLREETNGSHLGRTRYRPAMP